MHRRVGVVIGVILLGPTFGLAQDDIRQMCLAAYRQGEAFLKQGRLQEAARVYERAVELAPKAFGESSSDAANIINNLGFIYTRLAAYDKAEPLFKRSLAIRIKLFGEEHAAVAGCLNSLGELYRSMGRLKQAEEVLLRSLGIRERTAANQAPLALTLNNLGLLCKDLGQYERALDYYQRGLRIFEEKLPRSYQLATTLDNLVEIYALLDQVTKVPPLQQRALKMFEDNLGRDDPETAVCLNNIGFVLHRKLGQPDKAEPYYLRCLEIQEAKLPADHPGIAQTLTNLAVLYQARGQFSKAEALFRRSQEIREKRPTAQLPRAMSLNDLAFLHEEQKRYDRAEALYQQSIELYEAGAGKEHAPLARVLTSLGILRLKQGKYDEAAPLLERSLAIRRARYGPDHPAVAQNLGNLSLIHLARKDWTRALQSTEQDMRIVHRSLTGTMSILTDREQLDHLRSVAGDLHASYSLGLLKEEGVDTAQKSAGWVMNFHGIAQRTLAERTLLERAASSSALKELVGKLRSARRQLAVVALQDNVTSGEKNRYADLQEQEQNLAAELARRVGGSAKQQAWIEVKEIRDALPLKSVLIEIARFRYRDPRAVDPKDWWQNDRYVAWVVPPAGVGAIAVVELGDASAIDAGVADVQNGLSAAVRLIREQGEPAAEKVLKPLLKKLSTQVMRPLLPHVGNAEHLIVAPDGALWLAPWATLVVDDDKYALERFRISHVIAGRDLVGGGFTPSSGVPVIFADPDFDLAPGEAADETSRIVAGNVKSADATRGRDSPKNLPKGVARLPGTGAEAEAVMPKLQKLTGSKPQVYMDRQALEGVFKAVVSPRILLASTHGFFLDDQKIDPGATAAPKLDNPLLRCGLLLAGFNSRGLARPQDDDGVLTGLEIVGVNLRGTELVALSACETGLGKTQVGEGVAGLRQAFHLAGARTVLATLWQIPDRDSALLMTRFFEALGEKMSPAEALRRAQIERIESRRKQFGAAHPFFWAAFNITSN